MVAAEILTATVVDTTGMVLLDGDSDPVQVTLRADSLTLVAGQRVILLGTKGHWTIIASVVAV